MIFATDTHERAQTFKGQPAAGKYNFLCVLCGSAVIIGSYELTNLVYFGTVAQVGFNEKSRIGDG